MVADHPYFVTFRIKGTLPQTLVQELRVEREQLLSNNVDEEAVLHCLRKQFYKIENVLDCARGTRCYLENPQVARCVLESFAWLQKNRGWRIYAVTIMPNHVHALMRNFEGRNDSLSGDLGDLKSVTARQANKILGRSGAFWQDENFDHWCRNWEKFEAARSYINQNPVKARLVTKPEDWPYTRIEQ
ncbi:MAG: transposase [Kiritimatiellae bacterium]|nr:transposase [Kiritimatiellia bacterium]